MASMQVLVGRSSRCGSALYHPLCPASDWHATLLLRVPLPEESKLGRFPDERERPRHRLAQAMPLKTLPLPHARDMNSTETSYVCCVWQVPGRRLLPENTGASGTTLITWSFLFNSLSCRSTNSLRSPSAAALPFRSCCSLCSFSSSNSGPSRRNCGAWNPRSTSVGPWTQETGGLHTERLLFESKVDVLSAGRVPLLRDLGAMLEHRAHRRIRCLFDGEGLGIGLRGFGVRVRALGFGGLEGKGEQPLSYGTAMPLHGAVPSRPSLSALPVTETRSRCGVRDGRRSMRPSFHLRRGRAPLVRRRWCCGVVLAHANLPRTARRLPRRLSL
jgi:hypothetical protein